MSVLTERVRKALAPDYEVLEEIAHGGMGVVYRARDSALDKIVAIKIIRPDMATANASERFRREARALASFNHPNIVPVHRAGESDGFAYYVMDFVEGASLAHRLAVGPLPAADVMRLADELLSALASVHAHGLVHRDIKPLNIFLANGRAVLGDFGLAKSTDPALGGLTQDGMAVGTLDYMPPEQLAGGAVTERTDICAAGMVIYEAFTGRQWKMFDPHSDKVDWRGVPLEAIPALQRALALEPEDRWASAEEFRTALLGLRARHSWPIPPWVIGAAALVAVAAVARLWPHAAPMLHADARHVAVRPFVVQGGGPAGLADSLTSRLLNILRLAPDVQFDAAPGAEGPSPGFSIGGTVTRGRGDSVSVQLQTNGFSPVEPLQASGAFDDVLEALASRLLLAVWTAAEGDAADLPVRALPASREGRSKWAHAEALWARASWDAADRAYRDALRSDSSCLVCVVRLSIISRWRRTNLDTAIGNRVVRGIDSFPANYRLLINAGHSQADRWKDLDSLNAGAPNFVLGQFVYADELFHRGPLVGRTRSDALRAFKRITQLDSNFVPAWEHLAWVAAADGDSAVSLGAVSQFMARRDTGDLTSAVLLALHQTGSAWRFLPDQAEGVTGKALLSPEILRFPDLALGTAFLVTFDVPDGAIAVGKGFTRMPGSDLQTQGLLGQIGGLFALGRVDSAARIVEQLRGVQAGPRYSLAAEGFVFAQALFDFDSLATQQAWPSIEAALQPLTREGAAAPEERRRAAWMLTLASRRAHDLPAERRYRMLVLGEPGSRPLGTFLVADSLARGGNPRQALLVSRELRDLDSAQQSGEPFFRSVLHTSRAQWHAATGDTLSAISELRWAGNADIVDHASTVVQAVQVDWAFGTLARWRMARLQDAARIRGPEACDAYRAVARLWKNGNRPYQARADTARTRLAELHCQA